jgi:MoxR-like ATPase
MILSMAHSSFLHQDTGCGKTTVVQLMSVFLNRELQIVNCHASTETSDLLGGLRPLRGRRLIMNKLVAESFEISNLVTILPELQYVDVPEFLKDQTKKDDENGIPNDATQRIMIFVKKLRSELLKITKAEKNGKELTSSQCEKKRKLANGGSQRIPPIPSDKHDELLSRLSRIEGLHQQYVSLFEWVDGPLVSAMKAGHLFLLDEMSLAEDAVLERLNSVLEPSRTLTLAEKGGDDESGKSSVVQANDEFRVFATMNPGGDFGKRELSPALRSRFTEIWVPAVTDCGDIDLVLQQALSSSLIKTTIEDSLIFDIKTHMLAYVNWFNNDICGKPMSTCADFVLSLRDVLAWARFIIDTNKSAVNLGLWAAYVHGASLMHLDGLGLGTGLTHDDASTTKNQAKGFLREQVPHQLREKNLLGFDNELDGIDESLLHRNNNFGIDPFVICTGPESIPCGSDFKMSAPTTALNLRRVLRAMQISKPILLEGSPGVGKTSLISALASMSGHTLVRINLSEQTDITDLMGSDLPVPDEGDGQASGASFRWCDGALLRAIKNGHWVLLDELNLASQSVLEGLNSCLDHRASVYVPELGQTFKCPPSFRIFAAQNPLAQGGGRKGLPKSFLNRFTKVYVEALTKDDLRGIVSTKFSMIPSTMVEHIVQFNCAVQQDIDQRKYGQLGSPWEFNLRDVFRWCELISYYHQETGQVDCEKFADTIYIQRLRSEEDRHLLKQRYKECFGDIACFTKTPNFDVYDGYIQVGNARVQKSAEILSPTKDILIGQEPAHLRSLARPMEAVAFCVQMTWPCLLVGPPACGKSTVLKTLAEACNVKLEEVVLTPSSDVNELIGCFEQIDAAEVENRLLLSLRALANYASITLISDGDKLSYLQKINTLHFHLHEKVNKMRKRLGIPIVFGQGDLLTIAKELVDTAVQASNHFDRYSKLCKDSIRFAIEDIRSFEKANTSHNSTVHFRWVDGILVTALEKGYWLNLENVNFCPSSVLDRLNPLMETDGVLVLTECGIQEDANNNGTSRVVKPHPNFRLFLSTNPAFGEVSRAMRNRCIEVSILSPAVPQLGKISDEIIYPHSTTETVDMLDLIVKAGLASPTISKFMLHSHAKEFGGEEMINEGAETSRSIKEWAMLVADASRRGFIGDSALKVAGQIAYGLLDSNTSPNQGVSCEYDQLVNRTQIRSSFSGSRIESIVSNDARLVKIMETCKRIPLGLSCFGKNGFDDNGQLSLLDKYAPALSYADSRLAEVRNHLTASFVRRSTVDDAMARSHFLVGYFGPAQKAVHHMITKYFSARTKKEGMFSLLQSDRLSVIYSEYQLYYDLKQRNQDDLEFNGLSVMQLSFCVYENKVDRSHINCPVIPIIYPLFIAIDTFLDMLESTIEFDQDLSSYSESLRGFLSSRDRLWMFLKEARVLSNSSFLAFDETGFLVHWNWVKKSLFALEDATNCSIYSEIKVVKRQLDLIMSSIDRKLFISNGDLRSMSNSFWKFVGHPLVPANADDWTSIDSLRQNDIALSPICEEKFSFINVASGISKGLTLEDLINCKHPSLSATSEIKMEVLSALCMAHWTTTDEMSSSIRKEKKNYDISNVTSLLINKIQSSKEEMSRKLHIHAVDSSVHLDVNKLDLHELEKLKEACSGNFEDGGIDLVKNLLLKFGKIQLMQTVEFWCVKEEKWIIESLAAAMISNNTGIVQQTQKTILPRMKAYIDVVANETVWPISDLRPLQSIVWFMESNHTSIESFRHLFRSTYSTLLVNSARHHWRNTFNDLQCISDTLVSPPFWNSGQSQQNEQSLVSHMHGCDMGSARLHHNVISACLFRLLGLNRDMIYSSQKHPYLTLENFDVRQMQSRRLTQFLCKDLSVLNESSSSFNVLLFFTENIINSLHDSFDSDSNVQQLQSYILGRGKLRL